jgi:hypothetical protein
LEISENKANIVYAFINISWVEAHNTKAKHIKKTPFTKYLCLQHFRRGGFMGEILMERLLGYLNHQNLMLLQK